MADSDLTLQVLVEMRDELRNVRDEARQTNQKLGVVTERLDVTNQRLGIIEHTMVDYGTQLVMLGRYMRNSTSRHDTEIEDLQARVAKLEAKD